MARKGGRGEALSKGNLTFWKQKTLMSIAVGAGTSSNSNLPLSKSGIFGSYGLYIHSYRHLVRLPSF